MGGQVMEAEVLNISPAVVWVIALSQLLTFGLTVWNLVSSGSRANAKRLDEHGDRLQSHGNRLQALEMAQQQLPSSKEFHELEIVMTRVQGEMKTMSEAMRGQSEIMKRLEALVARHEDHLLKK